MKMFFIGKIFHLKTKQIKIFFNNLGASQSWSRKMYKPINT